MGPKEEMGQGSGHRRGSSLPPELDTIDAGWKTAAPTEEAERTPDPHQPRFFSEMPTTPRKSPPGGFPFKETPPERLRPSERVTAPPAGQSAADLDRALTFELREALTQAPPAHSGVSGPRRADRPVADPLVASQRHSGERHADEEDNIHDRQTEVEDVFDRPTLDVQADELAFARKANESADEIDTLEAPISSEPANKALPHDPLHPSNMPTAPPPKGFTHDLGRMKTLPTAPQASERDAAFSYRRVSPQSHSPQSHSPQSHSPQSHSPQSGSPDARAPQHSSAPPYSHPGPAYITPSGIDLAEGTEIGESVRAGGDFVPEASTLNSAGGTTSHREMNDRFAMGDFSGALARADALLADDPTDRDADAVRRKCREVLLDMYASRIAGPNRPVKVIMAPDQVRWLSLDHKSGFLLSMMDGRTSVDELLDVSGMPRLEAMRLLCNLLDQNVIELG